MGARELRAYRLRTFGDQRARAEMKRAFQNRAMRFIAVATVFLAVPFAAAQSTDVIKLAPEGFDTIAAGLGLIGLASFVVWLYRVALRTE